MTLHKPSALQTAIAGMRAAHPELAPVDHDALIAERDRYRAGLERIAHAESGVWGQIAYRALRGERLAPFDPLNGASRGVGRCTCPCGKGTDPSCPVHP